MTISYGLPDPDPNAQLVEPSHAQLHTQTNHAVDDIARRVTTLENGLDQATGSDGSIEQARLATHTWVIPDVLIAERINRTLLPLVWNVGDRDSGFGSAKASVLVPPVGSDILIDFVMSPMVNGDDYDIAGGGQTSILIRRLVIPDGENVSITVQTDGFKGVHTRDNWVSPVITQVGSESPGYGLSIQLNRVL